MDSPTPATKAERLAAALLADRERPTTKHNVVACFSRGQTFVYKGRQGSVSVWIGSDEDGHPSPDTSLNGRFCSLRCQQWFDDGNPSQEEQREHERQLLTAPLDAFHVLAGTKDMEAGANYYEGVFPKGHKLTPIIRRSSEGVYIPCKHCNKEFDSKGLTVLLP